MGILRPIFNLTIKLNGPSQRGIASSLKFSLNNRKMPVRRSVRIDAANARAAYHAGKAWYSAATAVWEAEPNNPSPHMPASVLQLEAVWLAAEERCSAAAKLMLAHDLFDQPLPGDLEERLDTFSAVEMLELLYPLV
jgi:hypothetical protein